MFRALVERNISIDRTTRRAPADALDHLERYIVPLPQTLTNLQLRQCVLGAETEWQSLRGTDLVGLGPVASPEWSRLEMLRILDIRSLLLARDGPGDRTATPRDEEKLLEDVVGQTSTRSLTYLFHGALRGRRNLCWLTPVVSEPTSGIPRASATLAKEYRNTLGLAHIIAKTHLVAMQFDAGFFSRSLHSPCVLDGADNPVYCSWLSNADDGGFTWDLSAHAKGRREFVSCNEKLEGRHREFQLYYVGELQEDVSDFGYDVMLTCQR